MLAPSLAAAEPAQITTVSYLCERGARVEASYINAGESSFAVVGVEGRQVGFEIAESASGARYVSADPEQPYVWWTKGETAMLLHGTDDAEAMLLQGCQQQD
jgi:membrane-bound inhibitor of C-type lysozyme